MMRRSQEKKKQAVKAFEHKPASSTAEKTAIANWLQRVKFKRSLLGGVREEDVWLKISELNALYEKALAAERIRCDVLIEHYRQEAVSSARDSDSEKFSETEEQADSRKEHAGIVLMEKRQ